MTSCPEFKSLIDRYLDLDGSQTANLTGTKPALCRRETQ
jgi:hypothetical protein